MKIPNSFNSVEESNTISPKLFETVLEYALKKLYWENKGLNIDGR